jgi:hypothetical protein
LLALLAPLRRNRQPDGITSNKQHLGELRLAQTIAQKLIPITYSIA